MVEEDILRVSASFHCYFLHLNYNLARGCIQTVWGKNYAEHVTHPEMTGTKCPLVAQKCVKTLSHGVVVVRILWDTHPHLSSLTLSLLDWLLCCFTLSNARFHYFTLNARWKRVNLAYLTISFLNAFPPRPAPFIISLIKGKHLGGKGLKYYVAALVQWLITHSFTNWSYF